MPKYRVLEKSFINNTIAEEGEIVEYSGKAGRNLELVEDEPAPKRKSTKTAEESSEDAN
jgi:hypothetical protein